MLAGPWCLHADTITGLVVKVTDGDTIKVLDDRHLHLIRLAGIHAPELSQAYGRKSRKYLAKAIAGQTVIVEYEKLDRYKRVVGKVFLDGEDMNLRQVDAGLAWHYKYYQREQSAQDRKLYAEAEIEAQKDRRGLWQEPDPVPPWKWRKMKRSSR